MTVLSIRFEDFKTLAGENRVYYYEGFDFYDFAYLVDGTIVKTTVQKDSIEDKERFFSDKLFYGAIALEFRIPATKDDPFSKKVSPKETINEFLPVPDKDISDFRYEESDDVDIQKEGVDGDDTR